MDDIRVVRYGGMNTLPAAYGRVFEAAGRESVFLTETWFQNFEATVLASSEVARIYGVELQTTPPSPLAALVMRTARRREGFLAPHRLDGMCNYYTSLFGPAIERSHDNEPAVLLALVDALWADRLHWDILDLHPLDPNTSAFSTIANTLRGRGLPLQTYFCFGNWYLEVNGRSYAAYAAGLPSTLRKNIPYYSRKLERSPKSRIEIIKGNEQVDRALEDFERVYQASWKIPEPYPGFIQGLVRAAARNGWLRFGLVYVNDEPAAAQIWLVHGDTATIYKIAYDEKFARLSLGTILTAKLMEHVIDVDRVKVVDYLTGDDEYKKNWMSRRRERWGIIAFNPRRLRGAWYAIRNVGGRHIKQLLHRVVRFSGSSESHSARSFPHNP